ncbi:MAG TPA: alpha-amylase family glycosyl hydrolase [Chryseosolibacter sp.]|nr:alpha-amylase family glycosyl hydrolase [Chryseosolibacter sp.]
MKRFAWIVLLLGVLSSACNDAERKPLVDWPHGVKYEIFVMSYADGNGDGKGDFKGLTARLDEISDLGVNGLWLMPIMPSDTYHKYHVIDYKNIDPDYGTLDDFKTFIAEAHARGIKVITDFVINHTGNNHPWFLQASKNVNSPYRDYYVWADKDSIRNQLFKKATTLDSDNIRKWHPANGDTTAEHYYGYFNGLCPDLNLDNPEVRAQIIDIARFWLEELKVDGFRMDAAKHIFPDERASDNHEFWVWFKDQMEKIKPDVYLVGEVWSEAREVAPYLEGLPSLFNFDLGYAITDVAKAGRDSIGLVKRYKEIRDYYKSITNDYLDATFIKNHDQTRLLSELDGDVDEARMAAALLLTMPGTPYIYYGEEIGMLGDKLSTYEDQFGPDAFVREPYVWGKNGTDSLQTSWEESRYSTDETVVPYWQQKKDPQSLLNFYKDLIQVRNETPALTYGDIGESGMYIEEVVTFRRTYENEELLVLHNVSDVEVTLALEGEASQFSDIMYQTGLGEVKLDEGSLTIPAYTTLILTK